MVQRLQYRRRNTYNTASNKQRIVRTPGKRLVYQLRPKIMGAVKCGDCKQPLQGIPRLTPVRFKKLPKHQRTVTRAYGGTCCHKCVRDRVLRAFIYEEKRCVTAVLQEKKRQRKLELQKGKKGTKKSSKKQH